MKTSTGQDKLAKHGYIFARKVPFFPIFLPLSSQFIFGILITRIMEEQQSQLGYGLETHAPKVSTQYLEKYLFLHFW